MILLKLQMGIHKGIYILGQKIYGETKKCHQFLLILLWFEEIFGHFKMINIIFLEKECCELQ